MTEAETAEAVSEVMSRYAPNGVAIEQIARDIQLGADEGAAAQLEPIVAVRAYLPLEDDVETKRKQIEEALWHLAQIAHVPEPTFRIVAESDWANAWKEHYHVVHLGERFVIKPTWRDYEVQPGEIIMELDPGMAFGTGLHPTTQMCLAAIEKYAQPADFTPSNAAPIARMPDPVPRSSVCISGFAYFSIAARHICVVGCNPVPNAMPGSSSMTISPGCA